MRPSLLFILAGAALLSGTPATLANPQPNAAAARPPLSIEPAAGIRQIAPTTAVCDAGAIDPIASPTIKRRFVLRNDGTAPVVISNLDPSCRCTTAVLRTPDGSGDASLPQALPFSLAPGSRVAVDITIAVLHRSSGGFTNGIFVYTAGASRYAAFLQVTGDVRPVMRLSTYVLDFGTVPAGSRRTLTLTGTFDRRLTTSGRPPRLVATDPSVRIDAAPGPSVAGNWITAIYRATFTAKAAGMMNGVCTFAVPAGLSSGAADVLGGTTIAVSGDVAAPGIVKVGQKPSQARRHQ
jgi:hypothetical protein